MSTAQLRHASNQVGVTRAPSPDYPAAAPYPPSEDYPEYPFHGRIAQSLNGVYDSLRRLFRILGYDLERYGTRDWNPLGHLIEPGMTVVIKPNFVLSRHPAHKDVYAVITHPSVLRAIADYCWIALRGQGKIVFADTPQYDCNFAELLATTRLDRVCDFYASFLGPRVEIRDLRNYWSAQRHFPSMIRPLPGDPEGQITVDLGRRGALREGPAPQRYYGAVYHRQETIGAHSGDRQEYQVAGTVMKADVVISVPKMKVHKKVGVTLNVKGLVGICTNKNLLVHYSLGCPTEGGDQYPEGLFTPLEQALIGIERWMYDHFLAKQSVTLEHVHRSLYWLHGQTLKRLGIAVDPMKRMYDAGNWYGNDSAWRMAADLARIIYFADAEGRLQQSPQRRLFSVVDGIIGGENNGPLSPDPKPAGLLAAGENLLAVDLVVARLMGFDRHRMRQFSILEDRHFDFGIRRIEDVAVVSDDAALCGCLSNANDRYLAFAAHPGWQGHLEVDNCLEEEKL